MDDTQDIFSKVIGDKQGLTTLIKQFLEILETRCKTRISAEDPIYVVATLIGVHILYLAKNTEEMAGDNKRYAGDLKSALVTAAGKFDDMHESYGIQNTALAGIQTSFVALEKKINNTLYVLTNMEDGESYKVAFKRLQREQRR